MGLPSREQFQAALDQAIAEAEVICLKAKADPGLYIQPEIGAWGAKWVSSRYQHVFNQEDRGKIDLLVQEAEEGLREDFPNVGSYVLDFQTISSSEETGNSAKSEAALTAVERLKALASRQRVNAFYVAYNAAVASLPKDEGMAKSVFETLFLGILDQCFRLYNTMLKKMDQGSKPVPVPGPGQHVHKGPMGDVIEDDHEVMGGSLVGSLNVDQFKKLVADTVLQVIKEVFGGK